MNKTAKTSNKTIITIIVIMALILLAGITIAKNLSAFVSTTQCNDKYDNDGDGRCDYGASGPKCRDGSKRGDTGCSSSSDNTEASCVPGSTTCGIGACQRSSTCVKDQVSCTPGGPSTEICDGIDNDCDGSIDDNLGSTTCGIGACQRTVNNCVNGQTQTCTPGSPSTEICSDSIDNDCNGLTDENCQQPDSCTDTDAGYDVGVQGTVSGYYFNSPYNRTDSCLNSTTLLEHYCSSGKTGTKARNETIGCTLTNSTCINGACAPL